MTVELVRGLPRVQAPRNFLLTPSIVAERQRTRGAGRRGLLTRRWLAPALTFATAASALLAVMTLYSVLYASPRMLMGVSRPAYEVAEQIVPEADVAVPTEAAAPAAEEPLEAPVEEGLDQSEESGVDFGAPPPAAGAVVTPVLEVEVPPAAAMVITPGIAFETPAASTLSETIPLGDDGEADRAAGPTPSAAPPSTLEIPPETEVAVAEVPSEGEDEPQWMVTPDQEPAAVRRSVGDLVPWLAAGGLVVLTAVLAVVTFVAWRTRRA